MNFFRRAIRYCWRQKIRSIILLLVFTLLASAALIALSVGQATAEGTDEVKQTVGASIHIEIDSGNTDLYGSGSENEWGTAYQYNGDYITQEVIDAIAKVDAKRKKKQPPLLYDLTELQREANQKFGFSARETLNIMQRLYENHKVLTYPRTDSRYLTSDVVETIRERLQAINSGAYRELVLPLLKQKIQGKPSFVNDSRVSDHHAIIPTEEAPSWIHMSNEERKIYDLVARRFLAVLYPACEYEETTLIGEIAGEQFFARFFPQ